MFAVINLTPIFTVFFLVFLEGLLSLDNALVLALLVRPLPPEQRKRALTVGIWSAFAFRFVALFALSYLMHADVIKIIGGVYLLFIALKGLYHPGDSLDTPPPLGILTFWRIVLAVELMDIAFSADSILAAVSISQSYFIVLAGGILGIVMMRFAANLFGKLIDAFPRFEATAYLLVLLIGAKLVIEGFHPPGVDFHASTNPASWLFWFLMLGTVASGFRRPALQAVKS